MIYCIFSAKPLSGQALSFTKKAKKCPTVVDLLIEKDTQYQYLMAIVLKSLLR